MIAKRMEQFLISNTAWVFFTIILLIGIILVKEQNVTQSWWSYASRVGWISLLYLPVLLFAGWRNWLRAHWSRRSVRVLWLCCFIIYPIVLVISNQWFFPNVLFFATTRAASNVNLDYLLSLCTLFLLAELALQANDYWRRKNGVTRWLDKISLERAILMLLFICSMLAVASHDGVRRLTANQSAFSSAITFLYYASQLFIMLLSWYFFYYVNHYFLIPRLLKEKGILYYGFGVAGTILLFYPVFGQLIAWLPVVKVFNIFPEAQHSVFQADNLAFIPFTIMLLTTPFILVLQWFKQSNEITTLAKEKSANELNFLKQQINPHFFFNTLNNLYALSLKKDEATPEIILQLSELMRYVIYRGKEETVPLAEEVRHIEDYIRLQMLRMYKPLDFKFEQQIADEHIKVPPLLFIVLVENAFKHGIEPAERESFLHICLTSNEQGLTFACENSVEERPERSPGVGLSNLRRRLALRFPDRHELTLEAHEQSFKATLKLDLP